MREEKGADTKEVIWRTVPIKTVIAAHKKGKKIIYRCFSLILHRLQECQRLVKSSSKTPQPSLDALDKQLSLFIKGEFLYIYRTERNPGQQRLIAILDGSSWEDFRDSWEDFRDSGGKPGKKLVRDLIEDLARSLMAKISQREFAPFILYLYRWFLINWDNSRVKESMITQMQDRMIPEIANFVELCEGQRWVISFDKRLTVQQKRGIIEQWLNDRVSSEDERIERWMAIHGLLVSAREFSAAESSRSEIGKVYSLYIDFLRDGSNSEIERIFGTAVEMDFIFFKGEFEGPLTRDWIQNILLKRFAIVSTIKRRNIVVLFVLAFFSLLILLCPLLASYREVHGHMFVPAFTEHHDFHGLPVFSIVQIFAILVFSSLGLLAVRKLSLIIWGGFIGWLLFVLAGSYGDIIHQSLRWSEDTPEILSSGIFGLLFAVPFFLLISLYLFRQEVKDANLIHNRKRRLFGLFMLGLTITFLEGAILISLFLVLPGLWTDLSSDIKKEIYCKWVLKTLAIGVPVSLFVGIITQLLWENRRITEVIRK